MSENKIEKGTVLMMTSGEYSDYTIRDCLRATQSFNPENAVERFKASDKYLVYNKRARKKIFVGSQDRFMAWLIEEGLAEPVEPDAVREWYLGWYEELEPELR